MWDSPVTLIFTTHMYDSFGKANTEPFLFLPMGMIPKMRVKFLNSCSKKKDLFKKKRFIQEKKRFHACRITNWIENSNYASSRPLPNGRK